MSTHTSPPWLSMPRTALTSHPRLVAWLSALLMALLPLGAGVAQAETRWASYEREQRQERDPRRERPGQRPMREAIGEVEQNYRGHVVDVQSLRRDSDEDVYRMRVLQRDGRVKTVTVPVKEQRKRH